MYQLIKNLNNSKNIFYEIINSRSDLEEETEFLKNEIKPKNINNF